MSKIAIVENGKVTYHGLLPDKFKNSNMNVTGLRNSEGNWESLNLKGIFELEEVIPVYDSATHKIDRFTFDIQESKVVKTLNIREKTEEEFERIVASVNEKKIQDRMRKLAIDSLKVSDIDFPADYE